jgi:hypothetical protein
MSRHEKIIELYKKLSAKELGPRDWLLENIQTVIKKVEVQVFKLKDARDKKNRKLNISSKTSKR